ncbi:MAG TPA: sensor histidine kinase [Longimicrobiales bacterium]
MPTSNDRVHLNQRDRLLILGFWTLFGLLETTGTYFASKGTGAPLPFDTAVLANMPFWLVWAMLTPVAFWLAYRFQFREGRPVRFALVHFPAALLLSGAQILIAGGIYWYATRVYFWTYYPRTFEVSIPQFYAEWAQTYLIVDVIVYFAIVGAYYALDYHRRYRERELEAARLETQTAQLEARVTEARLAALRMELNPHFLFNTLNAISALVRREENKQAVSMLARLGDLLRVTLERGGEQEIPLEKELEYLARYLEIERVRFHDRLCIETEVAEDAAHALVPTFILQPLVENAVRHGISRSTEGGTIRVAAHRASDDRLVLTVADSGVGFRPRDGVVREGVGMKNTRARLEQLYGSRASLAWENVEGGGARVTVLMPFVTQRETVDAPAAASVPGPSPARGTSGNMKQEPAGAGAAV